MLTSSYLTVLEMMWLSIFCFVLINISYVLLFIYTVYFYLFMFYVFLFVA